MTTQSPVSPAELADRTLQLVAASLLALALIFCLSVAEFFVTTSVAAILDLVVKALAIAVLGLMAMLYLWKFRSMSRGQRKRQFSQDGFLQIAFRRSMARSWMLTFVVLAILQVLDKLVLERLPAMPAEIVIQAILALMLVIFSLAFLSAMRWSASDE